LLSFPEVENRIGVGVREEDCKEENVFFPMFSMQIFGRNFEEAIKSEYKDGFAITSFKEYSSKEYFPPL
jgi:hypothetical protein